MNEKQIKKIVEKAAKEPLKIYTQKERVWENTKLRMEQAIAEMKDALIYHKEVLKLAKQKLSEGKK